MFFEQRDLKGLYKKARAGDMPNFTGIGAEFEESSADLRLEMSQIRDEATKVITFIG